MADPRRDRRAQPESPLFGGNLTASKAGKGQLDSMEYIRGSRRLFPTIQVTESHQGAHGDEADDMLPSSRKNTSSRERFVTAARTPPLNSQCPISTIAVHAHLAIVFVVLFAVAFVAYMLDTQPSHPTNGIPGYAGDTTYFRIGYSRLLVDAFMDLVRIKTARLHPSAITNLVFEALALIPRTVGDLQTWLQVLTCILYFPFSIFGLYVFGLTCIHVAKIMTNAWASAKAVVADMIDGVRTTFDAAWLLLIDITVAVATISKACIMLCILLAKTLVHVIVSIMIAITKLALVGLLLGATILGLMRLLA